MPKTYYQYIKEITSDDLYKGLLAYGLFSEKLPPIFSSEDFYDFSLNNANKYSGGECDYITFSSMRNINIPRIISIPNPFAYEKLCSTLKQNWDKLQKYFKDKTNNIKYKISRIHLRKMEKSKSLFVMNYNNWKKDDSPEIDLMQGCKWVVHADISTCFPSIYTHSLCWALVGKEKSKNNRKRNEWFNKIDNCCCNIRNGETHGLMIGPHASNLLSEIILTAIDKNLYKPEWKYIRTIDDYTCYVRSYELAQKFLISLNNELKTYDLSLNHKKTTIKSLPDAIVENWVNKLNSYSVIFSTYEKVNYKNVRAYLDLAIELMNKNGNSAIINYAIKVISKHKLTPNAQKLFYKQCMHLAFNLPYLLPLLEKNVFEICNPQINEIKEFANLVLEDSIDSCNFEGVCYAIYYALKYNFKLNNLNSNYIINTDDCLVKLFGMLYYKREKDKEANKSIKDNAKYLYSNNMDKYWIFVYETLTKGYFKDNWKLLKEANVTFLKKEFRY